MKSQEYYLIFIGLIVGIALTTQSGINTTLKTALASPVQSAFISFFIGTLLLGLVAFTQEASGFNLGKLSKLPWWAWTGGTLGAFCVAASIYLAPKLGALLLSVSVITGQLISSLFFDHFGIIGYPKVEITTMRVIGACLIVSGLYCVTHK